MLHSGLGLAAGCWSSRRNNNSAFVSLILFPLAESKYPAKLHERERMLLRNHFELPRWQLPPNVGSVSFRSVSFRFVLTRFESLVPCRAVWRLRCDQSSFQTRVRSKATLTSLEAITHKASVGVAAGQTQWMAISAPSLQAIELARPSSHSEEDNKVSPMSKKLIQQQQRDHLHLSVSQ